MQVVELMATAIKEISEAEFLGRRDRQNNQLPAVPGEDRTGYAVREWTLLNVLSAGSLLGKSCKGTLRLAGHDAEMQNMGYEFGKHLALAWQVNVLLCTYVFFVELFFLLLKLLFFEIFLIKGMPGLGAFYHEGHWVSVQSLLSASNVSH